MVLTSSGNYATDDHARRDPSLHSEDMKKLFVSKIPKAWSDDELKSFFENICGGNVTGLVVIRKETARNHFGFLTFESSRLVDEAIYKEKELVVDGTALEVNRACPKQHYLTGAHHKTTQLFITGIPKTGLVEEELKDYFDSKHDPKYGTVTSIQLIKKKDDSGKAGRENKGFGFITVSSEHLADTMSIQHSSFEFKGYKLELKKSDKDGKPGHDGHQGGRGGRESSRGGQRGSRGGQRGSRGGQRGGREGGQREGQRGSVKQSRYANQDSYGGYQYGNYDSYSGYNYNNSHSSSGYGSSGGYDQWGYSEYDYNSYYNYPQYQSSSSAGGSSYNRSDGRNSYRAVGPSKHHESSHGSSRHESTRGAKRGSRGASGRGNNSRGNRYAPYLKKSYGGS